MIELSRHIEILLLKNDCVIVPDLGGFMAHHIEARVEDGGLFLPPLRTLGFNPQLRMNDSLLAQSYAEAYDISYPEAVRRIESEVIELKQHLENEGSYELNDIGTLTLNDDRRYIFEPCEAGLLTPELYGLGSFEMMPFAEQKQAKVAEADIVEEPPVEEPKTKEVPLYPSLEPENDIKISRHLVRNLAVAAVAIIAFLVFTTPLANTDNGGPMLGQMQQTETLRALTAGEQSPAKVAAKPVEKPAEKVEPTAVPAAEEPAQTEAAEPVEQPAKAAEAEQPKAAAAEGPQWCIVLASQVTHKNAQAFVDQLNSEGIEGARVYVRNKVVRVIYKQYDSEAKAYNALNNLSGDLYFEDAWVMKM